MVLGNHIEAGIGLQKVRFRREADGRMEGIDEMWMRSEPCWPDEVPVLGGKVSVLGEARGRNVPIVLAGTRDRAQQ